VATEVKLPRLGQGMESGTVVKWLKAEGDRVEKGEPLYELDTDKVTQEVEADVAGVLLKIALAAGDAPVGQTIAWIGEEGEEVAAAEAPAPEQPETESAEPKAAPEPAPVTVSAAAPPEPAPAGGRVKASPLARRIARERGVDLASLTGTGPDGRIVADDLEQATAAAAGPARAPAGAAERVPLSNVRKTIARRLTEAWQAPVFQLTTSADMSRANALLARLKEVEPDARVTVTDLLAKLCAEGLMRHPNVNVQFDGDAVLRFPTVDVGIAVAAPHGLIVPVLRGVQGLSLPQIAAARADVVGRARTGKLAAGDLEGGTFTISNLGMFGVEQFIAVLNPPQAAILAVGATEERPVARDGEVVVRPMLTVTLTVDHRAVDGAEAADFLRTVKQLVEEPALAL